MKLSARAIRDGLAAGLVAGFVLAGLFYFYDLGQGAPLRTPAFLWGAIVQRGGADPTTSIVIAYTIIHFVVWALLGLLACVLVAWTRLPRNLLIGAAFGLFACSIVFYLGLIRAPAELVLSAPGWPAVFFGNAFAGIVIFTYLHLVSTEPGIIGLLSFFKTHETTRQGVIAGLIGAVTVAAWFLVVDSIVRDPLFTPAALGTLLFRGGGGPGDVVIGVGTVLGYTVVHFTCFVLLGVVLSGLAEQIERFPPLIFGLAILFVVFEVFFVALVMILGRWMLQELAWWSVLIGNLLAGVTMALYTWRAHPNLPGRLTRQTLWAE